MNIKAKIKIAALLIGLVYLIIVSSIYLFFKEYRYSLEKTAIAHNMTLAVFEERFLIDEYILNHSERARSQWIAKKNDFENELNVYRTIFQDSQKEKYLFDSIYDSMMASGEIFDRLIKIYDIELSGDLTELTRQNELSLSNQLLVNAQNSISAANNLADINNKNVVDSFRKIILLFSVSSSLLLVALFAVFAVIWKSASELYERKIKDEAILNGIGDGVVAIDRSWNIILFNKAASDLSGWSQIEVMGKPLRNIVKFIRESDRKENIEFIEKAMIFGKVGFMENHTVLIKKDGGEIPVGDSAAPLINENGQIAGAIIIFRDVSHEREVQSLRSDFAYASHQLRTPINKALWNLESIKEINNIETIKKNAEIAYMAMRSISKISGQLVGISEIDKGIIIVRPHDVKLSDVVNKVIERVGEDAKSRNIAIEISLELAPEKINTDSRLLEKILYEIIINAIVYNVAGKKVELSASVHEDDILFEIRDFGIGIPIDQQALVFTKFFRGNNFDTTNIVGGGLGLYIAREYVKLFNGKIWFESKENSGTVFYVSLPLMLKTEE